jgi:hypothetical protein
MFNVKDYLLMIIDNIKNPRDINVEYDGKCLGWRWKLLRDKAMDEIRTILDKM